MKLVLAALLGFLAAMPAHAALTRAQLRTVSASPPPGAHLDPNLTARDSTGKLRSIGSLLAGRTGFVTFVDYTCNTLCGTDLALLSIAIQNAHLASSQYRIVAIGIDPKDSAKSAIAMAKKEIPAALLPNTGLLLPNESTIRRATAALGFHYAYDPTINQFAHPAVIYAIAPDGELRAVFSPLTLTPEALRTAVSATDGPSLFARIGHLCYAYDPATGIYTPRIDLILKIAAAATVLLLAGAVLLLIGFGRRAA
jgi:protein SCO1/2